MALFKAPPGFFVKDKKKLTMRELRKQQQLDFHSLVSPQPNSKKVMDFNVETVEHHRRFTSNVQFEEYEEVKIKEAINIVV